jgi:two-component system, cell cycle response regulator
MLRCPPLDRQTGGSGAPVAKVLVADDSPLVLRLVEKVLGAAGHTVVTARDGLEAVEKAFAEDPSLVILDVSMPRLNGYQACRLLKHEPATRGVPVVILTTRDQPRDRFWGLQTGADYYLTKDAEPQRIAELVQDILREEPARERSVPEAGTTVDVMARVNDLLDRKLYEASLLSEVARTGRGKSFDEAFTGVMGLIAQAVDHTLSAFAFVDDGELEMVVYPARPAAPGLAEDLKARVLEAVAANAPSLTRVAVRVLAPPGRPFGVEEEVLGRVASFPVVVGGSFVGLLAVAGRSASPLDPDRLTILDRLAEQAHMVLENARLAEKVGRLRTRDSVTGLVSREPALVMLRSEYERAARYEEGLSVLLVGIDGLAEIVSTHGAFAADAVRRETARLLTDLLRTMDVVARYGRDELLALLPHTVLDEAGQTAERVRAQVEARAFRSGSHELKATVSIGLAGFPGPGSAEELLRAAEEALLRAREGGGNMVKGRRI